MRFFKKMGLIPMAMLCLVTACSEQDDALLTMTQNPPDIRAEPSSMTEQVTVIKGLLSIENGKSFDLIVDQLDGADDKWQDEFLMEVTGLTIDDLDRMSPDELDQLAERMEKEEKLRGINGDFVYRNFEENLGFKSLRALLTQQESVFLQNPNPDWDNDPDNHYVSGTAERTLLNAKGEIMVCGLLYKFMPNGIIYEVTDGDFNTLSKIGPEHATTIFEAPNVEVYNTSVLNERRPCRTWVANGSRVEYLQNKYYYKWRLGHRSLIFSNRVYSSMKHYKRKNGKWKKRRAHLKTNNWGKHGIGAPGALNAYCNQQTSYDAGERSKFARRITSRHETFGLGFGKVESRGVRSYYEANGFRSYHILEF